MTISAAMVMKLRERTGAGMMECKKFLTAAEGDIEKAIDDMRKAGQAKADKKADRVAAEGMVAVARSTDGRKAVMVEINSETDFAARDTNFTEFAQQVANTALACGTEDVSVLLTTKIEASDLSVEDARQVLVAKIGENIQVRRIQQINCEGVVGHYLHGSKIGVLVAINTADEILAKDIAMHVAASQPIVISRDQVSPELIAKEREIFTAQAKESGKPQEIIEKMIDGRINKFVDEVSLMGQPFVKNPDIKISQLLKEKSAAVVKFKCFVVGEGIEKKESNFAEEVMAQVRN